MSMMINYKQLWEDGGYSRDNSLEDSLLAVVKHAERIGATKEMAELVIAETFMAMAAGKTFSTEKCHCGCEIDKSGTDVVHYMFDQLVSLNRTIKIQASDLLERRLNAAVAGHMKRENEEYVTKNTRPSIFKRLFGSGSKS